MRGKIKIRSFLCLKTFLSLVSPVNLQGTVRLKSSNIRKYCKYQHDTKDRNFCKPEKSTVRFQVVAFLSSWGGTIYIYNYIYIYMYICILIYIYTIMYIYIYIYIIIHLCIYIYVVIKAYIQWFLYIYICTDRWIDR